MPAIAKPRWVFEVYMFGLGDSICAADSDLPLSRSRRLFWRIRGAILCAIFGWWQWTGK